MFEPNAALAEECRQTLCGIPSCTVIQKGTWDCSTTLKFAEAGEGSHIDNGSNGSDTEIQTATIDETLNGNQATFIKMDVEGAEYKSLLGASKTISRYKPKLAISVYHRRDDIWEIPMLILRLNPDYKFYMRAYSFTGNDTVLYAIP